MASKQLQTHKTPEEFPDILHDLVREILRDQPTDILKQCTEYFEAKKGEKEFVYTGEKKEKRPPNTKEEN